MNRLAVSLIFSLVGAISVAHADPSRPRLVVAIVVDQLRTDYLEFLKERLGNDGFHRLMSKGVYLRDVNYQASNPDLVSATATIFTGTYPDGSGITGARAYNHTTRRDEPVLNSPSAIGNFTQETLSPAGLLVSTISDEVAIDGAGLGAVYSIAADPQQAIIMAGHAGNSAVWINENTGKWASSAYYSDMPQVLSQRNYKSDLASRIDTIQWKPMYALDSYKGVPAQKRYYPFRYTFPRNDRDVYQRFKQSPMANREVTDAAIDLLRSLRLGGRGDAIDMLSIGYTAAPFKYVKDGDYRLELQDTYLRLDADLTRLFKAIDTSVGLDNTLIMLSSTGYYDDATIDDPKYRIPGGEFSVKRGMSLLNAFLSAKYGNGDYVEAFKGAQIFLNHKLIESKGLSPEDVTAEAREFICKMSGVADAVTLREIIGRATPKLEALRLSVNPKNSGDIFVEFSPGWVVNHDVDYPSVKVPVRSAIVTTPAFFAGAGIDPKVISTEVDASSLASTLSQALRIRSPNGSSRGGILF